MPINYNVSNTCVSMHNTNSYQVLCNSQKYFHLAVIFVLSHLWSLIVSLTERHIARNYILYACMYVYICAHIYIHSCSSVHIHPFMYTNVHVYLYPSIHTHRFMYVCLHTCIYTYIDSCMFVYICTNIHTYIHMDS